MVALSRLAKKMFGWAYHDLPVRPKITTGLTLTNGHTGDMPCTLQPATLPSGVIDLAREAANPDHVTVRYRSTHQTWPTIRLSWIDI